MRLIYALQVTSSAKGRAEGDRAKAISDFCSEIDLLSSKDNDKLQY